MNKKDILVKQISDVLDETIAEYEALQKGELTHTETTMFQGAAPNGDMASTASQGSGTEVIGQGSPTGLPNSGGSEYDKEVAGPDKKTPGPQLSDYTSLNPGDETVAKAIPPGMAEEKDSKPEDEKDKEEAKEGEGEVTPEKKESSPGPGDTDAEYAGQEEKPEGMFGEEGEEEGKEKEGYPEGDKKEMKPEGMVGEEGEEGDEEDEAEMEKFMKRLYKAFDRMGMVQKTGVESLYRSEPQEFDLEKSEAALAEDFLQSENFSASEEDEDIDVDTLMKSAVNDVLGNYQHNTDDRLVKMEATLEKLTEVIDKFSRQPAGGKRSVGGWVPMRKSMLEEEEQKPTLSKAQVIEKLLDLQKSGDKRVKPQLVAKYELSGDYNLVKDIIG